VSWLEPFGVACRVRLYHLWEALQNFFRYYLWHPTFFAADLLTLSLYFFQSPFRMVRLFDESHGKHPIGPYGETDFRTLSYLFDTFNIPTTASVADLGSGRGRTALFLRLVRGHKHVLGVEYHKTMAQRSARVKRWLHIDGLAYVQGDWATVPLDGIDVIYIYGLILEKKASMKMARHLAFLSPGTKIITISSWLGEEIPDSFQLIQKIPVRFDWGETEAFLQTVVWK
jgi:SAM-dependent methyltransferase